MPLNLLDIMCFLTASLSIILGVTNGAAKLTIGFILYILSLVASYYIYIPINEAATEYSSNQLIISIVSAGTSFIISALFCAFIAKNLKKLVEEITGGFTDRMLGGVLGVIRGLIFALSIFVMVIIFAGKTYIHANNALELIKPKENTHSPKWVNSAICYEYMNFILDKAINIIGEKTLKDIIIPRPKSSNLSGGSTNLNDKKLGPTPSA